MRLLQPLRERRSQRREPAAHRLGTDRFRLRRLLRRRLRSRPLRLTFLSARTQQWPLTGRFTPRFPGPTVSDGRSLGLSESAVRRAVASTKPLRANPVGLACWRHDRLDGRAANRPRSSPLQGGRQRPRAGRQRIASVLNRAGAPVDVRRLCEGIRRVGRVAVHFHPDRIAVDGRIVIESLRYDGDYRNQFETRISNGGTTAFPGGERDLWEQRLFDGAYQQPGVTAWERPKYGTLHLMG